MTATNTFWKFAAMVVLTEDAYITSEDYMIIGSDFYSLFQRYRHQIKNMHD